MGGRYVRRVPKCSGIIPVVGIQPILNQDMRKELMKKEEMGAGSRVNITKYKITRENTPSFFSLNASREMPV